MSAKPMTEHKSETAGENVSAPRPPVNTLPADPASDKDRSPIPPQQQERVHAQDDKRHFFEHDFRFGFGWLGM